MPILYKYITLLILALGLMGCSIFSGSKEDETYEQANKRCRNSTPTVVYRKDDIRADEDSLMHEHAYSYSDCMAEYFDGQGE